MRLNAATVRRLQMLVDTMTTLQKSRARQRRAGRIEKSTDTADEILDVATEMAALTQSAARSVKREPTR